MPRRINDKVNFAHRLFEENGRIYGFYRPASGIFKWFVVGGADTYVEGLTNAGVFVGYYDTADGGYQAFVTSPVPSPAPSG